MYRGYFPGLKRLGPEVDHLSPTGAKVKNEWSSTSAPPVLINGVNSKMQLCTGTEALYRAHGP